MVLGLQSSSLRYTFPPLSSEIGPTSQYISTPEKLANNQSMRKSQRYPGMSTRWFQNHFHVNVTFVWNARARGCLDSRIRRVNHRNCPQWRLPCFAKVYYSHLVGMNFHDRQLWIGPTRDNSVPEITSWLANILFGLDPQEGSIPQSLSTLAYR